MLLPDLAAALGLDATGLPAVAVTGVTHNAAWVRPGYAFVAIRGTRVDGHAFIADAAAGGAVADLARPPRQRLTGLVRPRQRLQLPTLGRAQRDRYRNLPHRPAPTIIVTIVET